MKKEKSSVSWVGPIRRRKGQDPETNGEETYYQNPRLGDRWLWEKLHV